MTDNEIITVLECCGNSTCNNCGFGKQCDGFTPINLALDLINRQKVEIESFKNSPIVRLFDQWRAETRAETIKEFAERLKAIYGEWLYDHRIDDLVKEMGVDV